jgi:hypothetical protein
MSEIGTPIIHKTRDFIGFLLRGLGSRVERMARPVVSATRERNTVPQPQAASAEATVRVGSKSSAATASAVLRQSETPSGRDTRSSPDV